MKRSYIAESAKAALHPLRDQILRLLKDHDRSTVELEAQTHHTVTDSFECSTDL